MTALDPRDVAAAAQLACLLEVSAPKPGNVSPTARFGDVSYEDYLASAAAIGPAIAAAGAYPIGATVRAAVECTGHWVHANTNLGVVLLLAPLARAALTDGSEPLRSRVAQALAATTIADAAEVYAAIRAANPGGLGRAETQDVREPPTVTLREAMALAADRDTVAREYVTDFAVTFDRGAPALERARREGLAWDDAVVETFLILLAEIPDTHIARKLGLDEALAVSRDAAAALAAGGVRTPSGRAMVTKLDLALRDETNARNPGTTADLTAAAIFAVLLGGGWRNPTAQ